MEETEFLEKSATLRSDRSSGASELARQALALLHASALALEGASEEQFCVTMEQRCTALAQVRPSMAVVATQVERWRAELRRVCSLVQKGGEEVLASVSAAVFMADHAARMIEASHAACAQAATHMAQIIGPQHTIITLSSSSTLNATFARVPKSVRFIVAESRPLNEGVGVAQYLLECGFHVTLITEAQLGLFVSRADLALLGADAVLADGTVVNKAGSYLLALAAHAVNVPVYFCHESFKECLLTRAELEIEALDVAELGHTAVPARAQRNLYFDCTPAHLISARVTELGVING